MATGTVKESEEKRKREETLAEARRELREAMARYARARTPPSSRQSASKRPRPPEIELRES